MLEYHSYIHWFTATWAFYEFLSFSLVNCDELETSPSQEDVVTPASQEEGLQQRQPSDSVLQIPSVSTPKAHSDAELGTNLVASSTANEEERKPAAEAPVIHISPSPSLDEDVQRSAHRQPTPPHSPITRRFTFEDGTLMCNYPTFSDPEVISNGGSDVELHSPNNIYSSQYLGEQREKQEEVELATPTSTSDNPNGRDIVPITTGNDNSSKDGGTDVGPIELAEYLSYIGGDHLQGPEPEQQPEHPQVIPAHSNEGTSDAEGLYAVPIINPQRSAHSDSTGGIERDQSTLFDDPGYMRGMMFLRQHTSPQLPWYQDSEDWPPPTALRRAHSHGSLAVTFTEEGTSRPPAADQDLPVTLTRKSRVLASSMDALRLVNIQISELEDLDPDIAAAWFGSPAGQVVGEAVTDV